LTHSVSAGLDYAAVGPEHSLLRDMGRTKYASVTDREAIRGFDLLSKWEGILPALETAHAIGYVIKQAGRFKRRDRIIINVSGRGDKDVQQVAAWKATHRTGKKKDR